MKFRELAFLSLFVLLACLPASATGLDDIVKRGTIRIGVCEFPPWTFTNRADALEGHEIDLGSKVALNMGVKPEFKPYALDQVLEALAKGEIDFVAAGLAITPSRALKADFSIPYFESGVTIAVNRKKTSTIQRAEDLNQEGYIVAVVSDTLSADLAPQLYDVAEIKTFPDEVAAERELVEGRVHGFLTSVPAAQVLAARNADSVAAPLAEPILKSAAGFAVQHGNQSLLNYLNSWIASQKANNWLNLTYSYWFSGYEWTVHLKE